MHAWSFRKRTEGASLIEALLVMVLMAMLVGVAATNIFTGQQHASFSASRDGIIRDLREQQYRAMAGEVQSAGVYIDYSIRFESDRYILYPGSVYDAGNSANTVVPLEPTVEFSSIGFVGSSITFARLSGDVRNYIQANSTITVRDTQTNEQTTIVVNMHGIPFSQ